MARLFLLSALFFIVILNAGGQEMQVVDKFSREPVERVLLYCTRPGQTSLSNKDGMIKLTGFTQQDTLFLQHPSYYSRRVRYVELEKYHYIITLEKKTIFLDEVVVSASKWEQKREEVPNKILSITPQQVQLYDPQTSADLLELSHEVFVQKSQYGGGSPMLRGFSANAVLLMFDGVRINNAIFRSGNIHNVILIDPNVIEKTEVILGPGSIIYGSDALGGVMDFHSLRPMPSPGSGSKISGSYMGRFSTASNSYTTHLDINAGFKKWASLSSFTFSSFGDLRTGSKRSDDYPDWGKMPEYVETINGKDSIVQNKNENLQIPSGYEQINFMQKFRWQPNSLYEYTYTFNMGLTTDINRYDRLIEYSGDELKYAKWYYGPHRWFLNSLNIKSYQETMLYNKAMFLVSRQDYTESRNDRKLYAPDLRKRTEKVVAYSLNADFEKSLGGRNWLYYGLEFIHNDIKSTAISENIINGETSPLATRYPDGKNSYFQYAAYANYKNNQVKNLTMQAGLRYSRISLNSEIIDNSFYDLPFNEISINAGALTAGLGAVYKMGEKWYSNINLASGFRAPNLDDAGKIFDSEPGNVVVPNPGLKPEYAYNSELGITLKYDERSRAEISFFYTILKDAMVRRDFTFNDEDSIYYDGEMSKVQALVNTGEAIIYGGSFSMQAGITERFVFKGSFTLNQGRDVIENIPLRHIPPLFGSLSLNYDRQWLTAEVYLNYNSWKRLEDMSPSEQAKTHLYTAEGTPAWTTLNLKTSFTVTSWVQINLSVENILDVHYRPYSSGISAPGRNFIFSLRGWF